MAITLPYCHARRDFTSRSDIVHSNRNWFWNYHRPDSGNSRKYIDADGLTHWEERVDFGTNPLDPDTDGDTMDDGWEVEFNLDPSNPGDSGNDPDDDGLTNLQEYDGFAVTIGGVTGTNQNIQTDPQSQNLLLEIDFMTGHAPSDGVLQEMEEAFADADIILNYVIDENNLAVNPMDSMNECRNYLDTHRADGDPGEPDYSEYVHAIFASDESFLAGTNFGNTIYNSANPLLFETSGIFIWDLTIDNYHTNHPILNNNGITLDLFEAKIFIHETGHTIRADHEKDTMDPGINYNTWDTIVDDTGGFDGDNNEDLNFYNVMTSSGDLGHANAANIQNWRWCILGIGNANANLGAVDGAGPRFSIETRFGPTNHPDNPNLIGFDLADKVSVETARDTTNGADDLWYV